MAVHIRHLREKIEIDPADPRYIKVVWGYGYMMEESRFVAGSFGEKEKTSKREGVKPWIYRFFGVIFRCFRRRQV